MSRYKNGNPKRQSRFICLSCMRENLIVSGIQRRSQREREHIKDLYCLNCKKLCKCCEVRYCDIYDEVYEKALTIRNSYYPEKENSFLESEMVCCGTNKRLCN